MSLINVRRGKHLHVDKVGGEHRDNLRELLVSRKDINVAALSFVLPASYHSLSVTISLCYFFYRILGKSGTGIGPVGSGSGANNPRSLGSANSNANTSAFGLNSSNRCTSDACTHRIHELESRVKTLTRELKDVQLLNATQASLLKQQQSQQQHQNSEQLTDLMIHLNDLETENACLKAKLKNEDKVKQELLAGYHNSLKEITELNGNLKHLNFVIADVEAARL